MIVRKSHSFGAVAMAAGFVIAGAMGPAFGDGKEETTNSNGGTVTTEGGGTVTTSWNPNNTCVANGNTSVADMLACVAEYIDCGFLCQYAPNGGSPAPDGLTRTPSTPNPCGIPPYDRSDWNVQYLTKRINNVDVPIGLNIVRWVPFPEEEDPFQSTDPQRLMLRETSINIQRTSVSINRWNLQAKIKEIEVGQTAEGGIITIGLNGRFVAPLRTTANMSLEAITQGLLSRIQAAGFQAALEDHYIVVRQDGGFLNLKQVSFTSTDRGIKISEIHLEPLTMEVIEDW